MRRTASGLLLTACLLLITGCGVAHNGSASSLATIAAKGYTADFAPLESPEDALAKADLIVQGRLIDVLDGMKITYADEATTEREAGSYVTLVIERGLALKGGEADTAYVQLPVSPSTSPAELRRENPQAEVLIVAENIDRWRPSPDAKVERPRGMPDRGSLYFAFNDGVWLQGPNDDRAVGVHAELDNLKPAWGEPQTIADLTAALETVR